MKTIYHSVGWTVQTSENEKFSCNKETSLLSFVTSEQSFKCSTEHLFYEYRIRANTAPLLIRTPSWLERHRIAIFLDKKGHFWTKIWKISNITPG